MKLENQVVSLELAKKLKELGVKQDSYFYHYRVDEMATSTGVQKTDFWRITDGAYRDGFFSAFTVAELGEIMKDKGMGVTAHTNLGKSEWWVRGGKWIVERQQYENVETDEKWADALAKMLVYLLENKLI